MRLIDADLALGEIPNEIKDYAYWIKAQPTVFDVDFILTELNYAVAITALEEIKQYRAIGTVEEITKINDFFNTQTAKILEKLQEYEKTGLTPQEITDGKLLTGWIPVEERLPEEPETGLIEMEDLQEYIVMIDGAELPTVLSYAGNDEWYRDGDFYRVLAWMLLPEPYEPEAQPAEMEGTDGSS